MMTVEDPWDVPGEALVTPVPLIGLVGLSPDKEAGHRMVWEMFSSNRGLDRSAINFSLLNAESLELPMAKPPRTSYEWYLPRGVLKRNWINKHLKMVPSVIVMFFSSPVLSSVSFMVSQVRMALASRQTKLAVVILEEKCDQDTITAICTECSIPARAVFCMAPPSSSQVTAPVLEFEETLQELASNYYHAQIKTVKSHRDHLNKATHLGLLVRHSFKIGFFCEVKGDLNSAYKSYTAAYLLLLESRLTEHNSCEMRCVAGILNFKICKLMFKLNLPRDAINQFRKHAEQWRSVPGSAALSWEQAAWQSAQAAHFASLFTEAVRAGQAAIHTQHPGLYYQLAAEHAISRRKLADSLCVTASNYPSPDPLEGVETMEFYGHRPWRVGKSEPSDLAKEKDGVDAMLIKERKVKHSDCVINLLGLAQSQYEVFQCRRTVNKMKLQIGEEMMVKTEYLGALTVLVPCISIYREDNWPSLTYSVLSSALKCAFLSADLQIYAALCLELSGLSSNGAAWLEDEKKRVWSNFLQILDSGKAPLPEPSLTAKSERASVGNATKAWTQLLSTDQKMDIDVTSFQSCLDVSVQLPPSAKANEEIIASLTVEFRGHGQISVKNIFCFFSDSSSDTSSEEMLQFSGPGMSTVHCKLNSLKRGIDEISIKQVALTLESRDSLQLTLIKRCPENHAQGYFQPSSGRWQPKCIIEPQESDVDINIVLASPALVGEWFRIRVDLENTADTEARELEVSCYLRDRSDPLLTDTTMLSNIPETPSSPSSPGAEDGGLEQNLVSTKIRTLGGNKKETLDIFMHASTAGERSFLVKMSSKSGDRQCVDTRAFSVEVTQPFECVTSFLTKALEVTQDCFTDEEFFVSCLVRNESEHSLIVLAAAMEGSHPVSVSAPAPMPGLSLLPSSSTEHVFPCVIRSHAMLPQLDSQTISPGKLVLSWSRAGSDIINRTTLDLPSLKLSRATMFAECILPPFGTLRSELEATYVLYNRTTDIQEFLVNIEPSDSFMFYGPKQSQIKLFPLGKHVFSLIIYPLVCGLAQLPTVKISSTEGNVAQVKPEKFRVLDWRLLLLIMLYILPGCLGASVAS